MKKIIALTLLTLTLTLTLPLSFASAEQKAHVHGQVQLSLGFDGPKGKISLNAPAETVYGFEHRAKTKKDKEKKESSLKKLDENISEMLVFAESSKCVIKKDFHEVNESSNHSDIVAEYSVSCAEPLLNSELTFNIQKFFPRMKRIKVNLIVDDFQKSLEVKKNGEKIEFK